MKSLRFLLERRAGAGITLGALFAIILLTGWLFWPNAFFRGYWFALMFWTQLTVGAWTILLIQHLSGGEWGRVAAPYLRAASSGFFFLLPLFLPPLLALPHIFPWTKIEIGLSSSVLVNKEPWLNSYAFTLRSLFYLVALGVMIRQRQRATLDSMAGPLLVFTIILFSFYSADWMMSLEPTFYSSLYPFMYFAGALVSSFSVICGAASWLKIKNSSPLGPNILLDYGTLLFASVLFWGYIVFSQFIIIWTGNLPDEAEWYVIRAEPAWLWLTVLLMLGHFAIPFCLLLSREIKGTPHKLLAVAAPLFVLHFGDVFWLMRPERGAGFQISPFDIVMPLLIGAGWIWFILGTREASFAVTATEAA